MKVTVNDIGKEVEIAFESLEKTVIGILIEIDKTGPIVLIPSGKPYQKVFLNSPYSIISVGNPPKLKMKSRKNTFNYL